ncbi:MAG TPA: P63C domain-containing protein [Gallionellaceae bacterium]|nr:P63C domain-containing protein [Gallionellaceae bacterium]HQS76642.1 P63C domain-containing protein [Gallionellaceae bacterium]
MDKIIKATHGDATRPLRIGDLEIGCYVLEGGSRVLSGRGMQTVLGLGQRHGALLRSFLDKSNLKPYINKEVENALAAPIRFVRPGRGGKLATGYEATILADICDALLSARKAGDLNEKQLLIAAQAEMLTRAFAKVGIIALIDEATGYQEVRDRFALQKILDQYLRKEFAAWAKRFPDEFYKEMFRLRGWEINPLSVKKPQVVGKYTTDIVYERLAPGIVEELERKNPKNDRGQRKTRHHQWLTDDLGHPALAQHIYAVMGLMRASKSWEQFMTLLNSAYPKKGQTIPMLLE